MSENKKITHIDDYLNSLNLGQRPVIEEMRDVIFKTIVEVEEKIMWSTPWYTLNNKNIAYIAYSSDHINFGFPFGVHLKSDLLEGTGKNMRHVKIKDMDDLKEKEKELVKLLREAEKL